MGNIASTDLPSSFKPSFSFSASPISRQELSANEQCMDEQLRHGSVLLGESDYFESSPVGQHPVEVFPMTEDIKPEAPGTMSVIDNGSAKVKDTTLATDLSAKGDNMAPIDTDPSEENKENKDPANLTTAKVNLKPPLFRSIFSTDSYPSLIQANNPPASSFSKDPILSDLHHQLLQNKPNNHKIEFYRNNSRQLITPSHKKPFLVISLHDLLCTLLDDLTDPQSELDNSMVIKIRVLARNAASSYVQVSLLAEGERGTSAPFGSGAQKTLIQQAIEMVQARIGEIEHLCKNEYGSKGQGIVRNRESSGRPSDSSSQLKDAEYLWRNLFRELLDKEEDPRFESISRRTNIPHHNAAGLQSSNTTNVLTTLLETMHVILQIHDQRRFQPQTTNTPDTEQRSSSLSLLPTPPATQADTEIDPNTGVQPPYPPTQRNLLKRKRRGPFIFDSDTEDEDGDEFQPDPQPQPRSRLQVQTQHPISPTAEILITPPSKIMRLDLNSDKTHNRKCLISPRDTSVYRTTRNKQTPFFFSSVRKSDRERARKRRFQDLSTPVRGVELFKGGSWERLNYESNDEDGDDERSLSEGEEEEEEIESMYEETPSKPPIHRDNQDFDFDFKPNPKLKPILPTLKNKNENIPTPTLPPAPPTPPTPPSLNRPPNPLPSSTSASKNLTPLLTSSTTTCSTSSPPILTPSPSFSPVSFSKSPWKPLDISISNFDSDDVFDDNDDDDDDTDISSAVAVAATGNAVLKKNNKKKKKKNDFNFSKEKEEDLRRRRLKKEKSKDDDDEEEEEERIIERRKEKNPGKKAIRDVEDRRDEKVKKGLDPDPDPDPYRNMRELARRVMEKGFR
ncbi:hypothetical protein UCRPC4_g05139 [Phaeomoniella chlamydospora]|uniref:Uncharacterized protein n=1 Tax=Phaeomoniella chlamydospora TaxID=158046 RepID=A0A0G2E706_PHACM|nr:hypothetical protein UCRPC4_g05139 [Phaeomoniella chlamydospora]